MGNCIVVRKLIGDTWRNVRFIKQGNNWLCVDGLCDRPARKFNDKTVIVGGDTCEVIQDYGDSFPE